MSALPILVAIAVATCAGFLVEAVVYRRMLERIPIRIHVNGTRGKSSVARLICAGLRAGGIRTCGKTTGTLARMIFADGREVPIFRPSRANIIEQKRVIRAAVQDDAEALVIECMALQPALQSVCELKLVRSTVGVITNARADHLDVMGPTRLDVARALSGTVPVKGQLFTAEDREDSLNVLRSASCDRGSSMEPISPFEVHRVTPELLSKFSYLEHPENVALALRVCEAMGVDRDVAIEGMWSAQPDPGAMRVFDCSVRGNRWRFVNAFAANDPESTERIWDSVHDRYPRVCRRVAVMNCRADRADRSATMAESCAHWQDVDLFVVMGTGLESFLRPLKRAGIGCNRIVCVGEADPAEVIAKVCDRGHGETSLVGVGNIAGPGMRLADHFEQLTLNAEVEQVRSPSPSAAPRRPPVRVAAISLSPFAKAA